MIKYKSFRVEDSDKLNKFTESNPAIMTFENGEPKDTGISLHHGYFIVRYEDGIFEEKPLALSNLYQSLNTNRNNVTVRRIESQAAVAELMQMFQGETIAEIMDHDFNWFVKHYESKRLSHNQAKELADKMIGTIQRIRLSELEIDRTEKVNIPILEGMIGGYNKRR